MNDGPGQDQTAPTASTERTPTERWADAGQIMAVFCGDPRYRGLPGNVLYLKTLPALALGQYVIVRRPMKIEGSKEVLPGPVAAILWARISDSLHEKFLAATERPSLRIPDWNSGDNCWIIDSPGDPRIVGEALETLHREQFRSKPFSAFIDKGAGDITTRTFGA